MRDATTPCFLSTESLVMLKQEEEPQVIPVVSQVMMPANYHNPFRHSRIETKDSVSSLVYASAATSQTPRCESPKRNIFKYSERFSKLKQWAEEIKTETKPQLILEESGIFDIQLFRTRPGTEMSNDSDS